VLCMRCGLNWCVCMCISLRLTNKLQQIISHGTHGALLSKLAVLSINVFCSDKETVLANLFQVCMLPCYGRFVSV